MNRLFTITDLAREFQVTTRTLRFYEEKGLLTPLREGNTRIFNATDRIRLKLILRGKRLGFSLDESREIIGMYEPDAENDQQLQSLLDKIREKQQLLQRHKQEINTMLRDLKKTEAICIDALSASVTRKNLANKSRTKP